MRVGRYSVTVHNHGFFRLDGGAMFGSVPKALWAKDSPPDDQNRILLATRSLVIEGDGRKILIDAGCGDKWSEKHRAIYCIGERGPGEGGNWRPHPVPGVTDVVLTHLHFDHAGGVSQLGPGGIEPSYPQARHFVSRANYEIAQIPNVRERASYLPENVDVLSQVDLTLTEDGDELFGGLTVHQCHGHTRGLQWIKLTDGKVTVVYPADLVPTAKHIPVTHVMGYDMCAETAMVEKRDFIQSAVTGSWILVFGHDPSVVAGTVDFDDRSRPFIRESVDLA